MNMHVVLLFSNAIIVSVVAAIVVLFILRKEYLPIIKELEKKELEKKELEAKSLINNDK